MLLDVNSSQTRSLPDLLASADNETFDIPSHENDHPACPYSMDKDYDPFSSPDYLDSTPFMYQVSASTFLSQASSPSPMDPVLSVRVENNGQPDDLPSHSAFMGNYPLFNDLGIPSDFPMYQEGENLVEPTEEVKENMSVEELLSGISGSQVKKDGEISYYSQSQSQKSQPSVKSQDDTNVLQIKSLDNSILSNNNDNYSQPLVIVTQGTPSYHGQSLIYNSSVPQPLTQSILDSQPSQPFQEGTCCRKHLKYFQKQANKIERYIDDHHYILYAQVLFTPSHNGFFKPPFSHNMLCALAIVSAPLRQQEVSGVYQFLMKCFPYFQEAGQHWKNSLRHSLATCDWFEKSDFPRTAKKGYKYAVKRSLMDCLRCEVKKQCIKENNITKLHHSLAGPYVCDYLINMGLLSLREHNMNNIRAAIKNYCELPPTSIKNQQ